jgi:hypothetical protein
MRRNIPGIVTISPHYPSAPEETSSRHLEDLTCIYLEINSSATERDQILERTGFLRPTRCTACPISGLKNADWSTSVEDESEGGAVAEVANATPITIR